MPVETETYLDMYEREIEPRLQKIDVALKSAKTVRTQEAAELLDVSEREIEKLMRQLHISRITPAAFVKIMENSDGDICNLFRREVSCGSPAVYTAEDIAYIYGIDPGQVSEAFRYINATEVSAAALPAVFENVVVTAES